jgi:hypothetical protein
MDPVKPASVTVSIAELRLDGVEPAARFQVAAALEAELSRLLAEGVPAGLLSGRSGTDLAVEAAPRAPADIGRTVARALYAGWR